MKIVLMVESFTKNMGYIENVLPKYLARLGVEVHVVSTTLPCYSYLQDFEETYPDLVNLSSTATSEQLDGFTVHTLPYKRVVGHLQMQGWYQMLKDIAPHVVQTTVPIGWIPLDLALAKSKLGYKLFTGNHRSSSTFPLASMPHRTISPAEVRCFLTRSIPGRLASLVTEKCYCPNQDCAEIAWKFFGVQQQKVEVMFLGVDTDFFYPATDTPHIQQEHIETRQKLGFSPDDIICVYSGKFTETKNALILAQAIERLRAQGQKFVGLFIGNGVQKSEISKYPNCQILDFMPYHQLSTYYRAADIGVWPTNESISMLDAAACGLPLVVSDGIGYFDHIEGNGLVYHINNLDCLVDTLLQLKDHHKRAELGNIGSQKMKQMFSWESIARKRLIDYETSLAEKHDSI